MFLERTDVEMQYTYNIFDPHYSDVTLSFHTFHINESGQRLVMYA